MSERVHFLGYVADEAIPALYSRAAALVMASYFGPTNIPPLEAFAMNTPVIASRLHQEQLGSGALYFDPDDAEDLARQVLKVAKKSTRTMLIAEGKKRLGELADQTARGEKALFEGLRRLSQRIL
jgi:glycosyltransferase involved in cell wall biosynthesis